MKGTRGFSLFLGVGQNEKSSSTSSLKCVYLCVGLCVEFWERKFCSSSSSKSSGSLET